MSFFKRKIKIAMVAPPFGDTGGPEVVAQNLTDALFDMGVDVTLFAPADWKTKAKHIKTIKKSIWNLNLAAISKDELNKIKEVSQKKVLEFENDFDIIHLHTQKLAAEVARESNIPCVVSFHNNFEKEAFNEIVATNAYTVTLSKSQKKRFKTTVTIHNGVPVKNIKFSAKAGDYLMFVGRLADQKGIDTAIQIALKAKKKLLIFGRIGISEDRKNFFAEKIEPFLDDKMIIYKGEVEHKVIYRYLKNAQALLFPIRRPEVCPMVVGEALACGTPVIGTKVGPLPELLRSKKVAFLSDDFDELVKAVQNIKSFDRKLCRKYAQSHFDSSVMAKKYLKLYMEIVRENNFWARFFIKE